MVVIRDAQRLHRYMLESQKQFGLVGEEQFDIGAFELDDHLGIFDFGIGGVSRLDLILDVKIRVVQYRVQKLFDSCAYRVNSIFGFAQSSLPDAWILCWRAADVGGSHGLVEEPLLCDTHKISSEPV